MSSPDIFPVVNPKKVITFYGNGEDWESDKERSLNEIYPFRSVIELPNI